MKPICDDSNQCSVTVEPSTGTISNGQSVPIQLTFIARQTGPLNEDWHIPCYIQNASQPIFLKLKTIMEGMKIEFRIDQKLVILHLLVELDFNNFIDIISSVSFLSTNNFN